MTAPEEVGISRKAQFMAAKKNNYMSYGKYFQEGVALI